MPPQKKKVTKIQDKNSQKITKIQDHIEEINLLELNDETDKQYQAKQNHLLDQNGKNQIISDSLTLQNKGSQVNVKGRQSSKYKLEFQQIINISFKIEKVNGQKVTSKESFQESDDIPKQPLRNQRKLIDQNKSKCKKGNNIENLQNEDIVSEITKISKNTQRKSISDSKKRKEQETNKKEKFDEKEKKNQKKVINNLDDDKELSSKQILNKQTSNQNFKQITMNINDINSLKQQFANNNQVIKKPIIDIQKDNINEKKKLTIQEMESISKLLSIQVDGLKMKEQQTQNSLLNQNNNNYNNNLQKISNKFLAKKQHDGSDPNHCINNLSNGPITIKKLKPNNDFKAQMYSIKQQNIHKLICKLPIDNNHIIIDEEQQKNKQDQLIKVEQDDFDTNMKKITEQHLNGEHKDSQQHVFQRHPLRSITPQNKIIPQCVSNFQPQKQQNMNGQYNQMSNQDNYNLYLRKSITPNGKFGVNNTDSVSTNTQFTGQVTSLNSKINNQQIRGENNSINLVGKITPINCQNNNKDVNGKLTPLNGIQRISIEQNNLLQQKQQIINIENEIQERIETIKSNIGPLLACLNSDLLVSNNQNLQKQQLQQSKNIQDNNFLSSQIYQDMRQRRFDNSSQGHTYQNIQLQNSRGRSLTPTLQGNRKPFEQDLVTQPHKQSINNNLKKITPIRGPHQKYQSNNQFEINIHQKFERQYGRNYDARAGDWICGNCKNFNFAYRNICNRCKQIQDENIYMIHPDITSEAMDLIHELNHSRLRKIPIQSENEIQNEIQNDTHQNKENSKNMQNLSHQNINDNQIFQRNNSTKPFQRNMNINEEIQSSGNNLQIGNRRYKQPTYNELLLHEKNLEINKIKNQQFSQNIQNINKLNSNSTEVASNQIIFIDNSCAKPNQESIQLDSPEDTQIATERQIKYNNQNRNVKDIQNNQIYQNQNKRILDPRIQIR